MLLRRAALALSLSFLSSYAQAEALRVDRTAERMRVDGALPEWRGAQFSELGSGDDASVRFALSSAEPGLYVAAEVRDDHLIDGFEGDAFVLQLQLPSPSGQPTAWELALHPGAIGKTPARALLIENKRPHADARVEVVEGPRKDGEGYVLEALVPWPVLGAAAVWKDFLWDQAHGSVRLRDVDSRGGDPTTLSSADAREPLPRVALGTGQRDLLGSFLARKQLSSVEPRFDFRADVAGDATPERVVLVDRYVIVYGPAFRGGESSGFYELPYGLGGSLENAALRDLTGDPRSELILRVRQQQPMGARSLWMALALEEARIAPLLSIEVKKERGQGFVENNLTLAPQGPGRPPRIDVKPGRSEGLSERDLRETSTLDAQPMLLPWDSLEARSYAWDGARFAVVSEKRKPELISVRVAPPESPAVAEPRAALTAEPTGDPLSAYKAAHKLPATAKPSRTLLINLLPGRAQESVAVFGTDLVLTGPEIGEGRGFVSYGLPISDPAALLELRAIVLSGGAADELLVRIRQPLGGAEGVERDLVLILRGEAGGRIVRALVAEVARRRGEDAIENRLSLRQGALVREPGSAKGWTATSYPFDSTAIGGAERLLLPWQDRPVRYQTTGSALTQAPRK